MNIKFYKKQSSLSRQLQYFFFFLFFIEFEYFSNFEILYDETVWLYQNKNVFNKTPKTKSESVFGLLFYLKTKKKFSEILFLYISV